MCVPFRIGEDIYILSLALGLSQSLALGLGLGLGLYIYIYRRSKTANQASSLGRFIKSVNHDGKFTPEGKNANPLFLALDSGSTFYHASMTDERCTMDLGEPFLELRRSLLSTTPCLQTIGRMLGFQYNVLEFVKQSDPDVCPELYSP